MSRVELLFEREAKLREAAINYSSWEHANPANPKARTEARRLLRQAAVNYASLVTEVDE